MQTAIDCICVEEFVHEPVGAEMELPNERDLTLHPVLQDNPSVSFTEQGSETKESSETDYGLEALRAGLSAQSAAPQLMPSKRHHVCWECSERFKTLHDLMEHYDQHQTSGHCRLCHVTFRRGASLAIHLENAHRDVALICPTRHCQAQLRNRWLLNQHIETCHTGDCVGVGVEVSEEVVLEEEEVVVNEGEEEPLLKEQPGDLQKHMTSDHSYHSAVSIDNTTTDHTYNTRKRTNDHVDPQWQYALSDGSPNAQYTGELGAMVETNSVQHRTSPLFDNRTQEQMNITAHQEVRTEGFLAEGAPIQWDEDEDFAEEEIGIGDESADMWPEYGDCAITCSNADVGYSESDSSTETMSDDDDDDDDEDGDSDSDSLPPGDSLYIPEDNVISDSDSDSSDSKSDSFSSDSGHSYPKIGTCVPPSGIKKELHTPITVSGVEPVSNFSAPHVTQRCPHCGLGPFPDLKPHMVKCCSKGPENCVKCRRVFSEDTEYVCVDCKKMFLGSAACKAHVCPIKFAAMAAMLQSHEKQPVTGPVPALLTQLPQLYQIVSLLPPGMIYTQAQSISTTQTSVSPSTNSAATPSNADPEAVTPASNNPTPTPPLAKGTLVTIRTSANTQVVSQTVQSPMLLQPPGLVTPSYMPVANNPSSVVKVFTQTSPKTQVILRGQTPARTPAPSIISCQTVPGASALTLVRSQIPSGIPVSTIVHSQAPSGKPVTVVCNQDRVRMPSGMVLCSQTPAGVPRFIVAPNQGQPRVPIPVVIQNHGPSSAVRHQAPTGGATTTVVHGCPGVSVATAGGTKPLFRIPSAGSSTLFFPLPNQPAGAAGPSLLQFRVPSPAGVSPQASQSSTALSKDSPHPVTSQLSTAVPSLVSVSSPTCPTSSTSSAPQAHLSSTRSPQVSSSLPFSQMSSTASVPTQASSFVSSPTQNPQLPAASSQSLGSGSQSDTSPLIVLSDSGPLRILFMFLNQSRELALAQRMKTRWHYKDIFTCRQCGAISRQPSLLVSHRYLHRGAPRNHRCCCGRRFQARLHLLRHQMLHAEATRYICAPCGDSFEGAQRLLRHQANCNRARRKRSADLAWRPFVCTCGRKFARPSALLWHKLNNSRHKPKARNETVSSHQNHYDALPST